MRLEQRESIEEEVNVRAARKKEHVEVDEIAVNDYPRHGYRRLHNSADDECGPDGRSSHALHDDEEILKSGKDITFF